MVPDLHDPAVGIEAVDMHAGDLQDLPGGRDTEQLAAGDYPHLEAIAGDDPAAGFERIAHVTSDEDRFERGLLRLLDGLEAWVEENRA